MGNSNRMLENPSWLRVLGSGLRAVRVISVDGLCSCLQPRARSPEQTGVFPQPSNVEPGTRNLRNKQGL